MSLFLIRLSVFLFTIASAFCILFGAPANYPAGQSVLIPAGTSVAQIASILAEEHAIRFPKIFSVLVRLQGKPVPSGTYLLPKSESVISLAYRFAHGTTGLVPLKVTIPEGSSVREAASILKNRLGTFDPALFIGRGKKDEGYLFPDTYFFLPGVSPEYVVGVMKSTFARRVMLEEKNIKVFGRKQSDVIIMASLLEKEARQRETRRIVAGILWKRISLGMPLQVDATFGYIFNKDTYSPSTSDLAADSPYNTYKYKGLPPGPIDNPGLEAMQDAITPITTPYLYYVTDNEGNIYYARTYDEQLKNIQKAKKIDKSVR